MRQIVQRVWEDDSQKIQKIGSMISNSPRPLTFADTVREVLNYFISQNNIQLEEGNSESQG